MISIDSAFCLILENIVHLSLERNENYRMRFALNHLFMRTLYFSTLHTYYLSIVILYEVHEKSVQRHGPSWLWAVTMLITKPAGSVGSKGHVKTNDL